MVPFTNGFFFLKQFTNGFFFLFCKVGGCGTKNSAVYSMRGTLQYRFTTARVQWPCSTDIHWACLITQSGPARYVPNKRINMRYELNRSGDRVTGPIAPVDTGRTSHHPRRWYGVKTELFFFLNDYYKSSSKKLCRPPILGGSR